MPTASQRDPVDSDGRVDNVPGGDHRVQRRPRALLARARSRGGDTALEGGSRLVGGEGSDQLEEKVTAKGRHPVLD